MTTASTLEFLRRVEELIATGRTRDAHILIQQAITQLQGPLK